MFWIIVLTGSHDVGHCRSHCLFLPLQALSLLVSFVLHYHHYGFLHPSTMMFMTASQLWPYNDRNGYTNIQ